MKTFDEYDEKEELFLKLSHLDELVIKFDFINYYDQILYFYKDDCLFLQDKKKKYFWISYKEIWSIFEKKYGLTFQEIRDFMNGMVEKHFKLNGYTTPITFSYQRIPVEKHFKLNGYTTLQNFMTNFKR